MIAVYEATGLTRKIMLAAFDTFAEAEAYTRARFDLVMFELDPNYPECADAFAKDGTLLIIQPGDFKVAA